MTVIFAILKSIGSAIGKLLEALPWQVWLFVAGVLVGLGVLWKGCDGGGCGCGCRRDPQPKYRTHGPFTVKSVDSGTSLTCVKGRKGKREQQVILAWIEGPGAGRAEEARVNLESLIGSGPIIVEVHRRGPVESTKPWDFQSDFVLPQTDGVWVRSECLDSEGKRIIGRSVIWSRPYFSEWWDMHKATCDQCGSGPNAAMCDEAFEYLRQDLIREEDGADARKPLVGIVVNSAGLNCNRAMVAAGLATCTPEAPESWKAAEAEAKKAKRGVWE